MASFCFQTQKILQTAYRCGDRGSSSDRRRGNGVCWSNGSLFGECGRDSQNIGRCLDRANRAGAKQGLAYALCRINIAQRWSNVDGDHCSCNDYGVHLCNLRASSGPRNLICQRWFTRVCSRANCYVFEAWRCLHFIL